MHVILVGNHQPGVVLGDPDEQGNVRVAVFGGEQIVSASEIYNVDGSQAYQEKQADVPAEQQSSVSGGEPQPSTAPGA